MFGRTIVSLAKSLGKRGIEVREFELWNTKAEKSGKTHLVLFNSNRFKWLLTRFICFTY